MSTYNGAVSSLIKGSSTGGENAVLDGISTSQVVNAVPRGYYHNAMYGAVISGISGTISIDVVASIAGATYVVAGATGIATNGSFVFGTTGGISSPRPAYVSWASAEDGSGFTGSVTLACEYN
jgi:hypothetical protein